MDLDPKNSEEIPETEPSKKRKMSQKTVVAVKIEENENKKHKSEGPPADSWSWRKYGQKPIKGSPYPRGYYRCSTSKSCLGKKQVERCRTDASLLLITYTCSHNHPSPKEQKEEEEQGEEAEIQISEKNSNMIVTVQKQEDPNKAEGAKEQVSFFNDDGATSNFHYIHSPLNGSDQDIITNIKNEEEMGLTENLVVFDEREKPLCYPHLMTFSTPKSEENDFFDELEELPTSSSFTSFMRGNFFEDRILIHLSNF